MQTFNFLDAELLDILFLGKNKQYGAYALRKFYPQRMTNAMGITAGLILLFFAVYYFNPNPPIGGINPPFIETEQPPIVIQDLVLPMQNDGKAGRVAPPPKDTYSPPTKIVASHIVPDAIPRPDAVLPPQNIVTATGTPNTIATPGMGGKSIDGIGESRVGEATGPASSPPVVKFEPSILTIAEVMPEFPGGIDALMTYLQHHIKYPKLANARGVEGTVFVQFVVSTTGTISSVKILSGVGAGCNEEATRVIRNMPKWTPGKQNGHAVNVEYVVPVKFEL